MANKTDESIDQAVLALLVKVDQKKKEIEKAKKRPVWKTSTSFGRDPSSAQDRVNIQTVNKLDKLLEIYAFLDSYEVSIAKAATELGLDFDITWQAYPIKDWKDDIRARVEQLSIEKKQRDLEDLDAKVNRLVSPEQRRAMELKALQQILGD